MISREDYIRLSIEENLFWLRIMKEHAVFIEDALPKTERRLAAEAERYKQRWEMLLSACIRLAGKSVSKEALLSGQYYTRFTSEAERIAQQFTGIAINRSLTVMETNIEPAVPPITETDAKEQEVIHLNARIQNLLNSYLSFKTSLHEAQASCRLATHLYTSVLEHILHEGEDYRTILANLQSRQKPEENGAEAEQFWNHIMSDHAKVMRGLFDPSEQDFIARADRFAKIFDSLSSQVIGVSPLYNDPLTETEELREFKAETTKAIIECKAKAMMLPLFTDHLMREAAHYIYLLQS
jgi:hypothetical protein